MNFPQNPRTYETEIAPVFRKLYEKHGADVQLAETIVSVFDFDLPNYPPRASLDQRIQQAAYPNDFKSLAFSMLIRGETSKAEEYLRTALDTTNVRSDILTITPGGILDIDGYEFKIPTGYRDTPKPEIPTQYRRDIGTILDNLVEVQRVITDSKTDFYKLTAKKGLKSWDELGRLLG